MPPVGGASGCLLLRRQRRFLLQDLKGRHRLLCRRGLGRAQKHRQLLQWEASGCSGTPWLEEARWAPGLGDSASVLARYCSEAYIRST